MAATVNQTPPSSAPEGLWERFVALVPSGRPLPDDLWRKRHQVILVVLWLHVVGLFVYGLISGSSLLHVIVEVGLIAAAAVLANNGSRRWRSSVASFGLITASAVMVHFAGGLIEVHFHFFVMLAVIVLYHDWVPFLLALGYVALHHGIVGVLFPSAVYSHPAAINNPWLWAVIHAAFVLGACAAHIASWQLSDHHAVHDQTTGLANRELFESSIERGLARARLHGGGFGVLHIDVRNFRDISSQWGRAGSDELLREVASRLRENLSPTDTIARLGWSEFGIATEEVRSIADLQNLEARVKYVFKRPITVVGQDIQVEINTGAAFSEHGADAVTTLLQKAELGIRSSTLAA